MIAAQALTSIDGKGLTTEQIATRARAIASELIRGCGFVVEREEPALHEMD